MVSIIDLWWDLGWLDRNWKICIKVNLEYNRQLGISRYKEKLCWNFITLKKNSVHKHEYMYWVCYIWSNKLGYVFLFDYIGTVTRVDLDNSNAFFFSILDKNIVQYVSSFECMVKIYIFRRHINNAYIFLLYVWNLFCSDPWHSSSQCASNLTMWNSKWCL